MSLHVLQRPGGGEDMTGWRRQAGADLAEMGPLTPVRRTLLPIKAYFPDFLTPHHAQAGRQNGIDALADTPPSRVRREVDQLRRHTALPATLDDLARGNQRAITGLARLAVRYCQTAFAPHRATMEHALGRERARLTRMLTDHGVEAMLAGRFEWRSFDGVRWDAVNAATVFNDTGDNLMINQKGAAKEAYPLDLRFKPELQALVNAVDVTELTAR
ncbi:hypothetical protein [Nonomuraea sp. NPDC003201]